MQWCNGTLFTSETKFALFKCCPSIIAKIKGLKLYFFLGIFDTYQSTEKPFLPCSLTASFGASVHLYNVIESQSLNFQDFNKKFSAKMIRYKNFWLPQIVRQSSIGRKEKRNFKNVLTSLYYSSIRYFWKSRLHLYCHGKLAGGWFIHLPWEERLRNFWE